MYLLLQHIDSFVFDQMIDKLDVTSPFVQNLFC